MKLISLKKKLYIGCMLTLIIVSFSSCKKEERKGERLEQSMGLYTTSATLLIGEEAIIKPKFAPGVTPKRSYQWTSDHPDVVSVVTNPEDYSATITAIKEGEAKLTIASTDGILTAVCQVQVIDGTVDVFINFGSGTNDTFADGWNLLSDFLEGGAIANLKNKKGYSTNISLTVTQRFNQRGSNGDKVTDTEFSMPESVSSSLFLGNSLAIYSGITTGQSTLKVAGLDKTKQYNFCFYGSRADYTDNRVALYTVKGTNESEVSLNASGNKTNIACVTEIQPDNNGEITITMTAGAGNSTAQGFYYINAMRLTLAE